MKFWRFKVRYGIFSLIVVLSFILVHIICAVQADTNTSSPGSESDPLVTQGYVDSKISELSLKINGLIQKPLGSGIVNGATDKLTGVVAGEDNSSSKEALLEEKIASLEKAVALLSGGGANVTFVAVSLKKGQKLLSNEAVELILRTGKAVAISGTYGGVGDLTSGGTKDLLTGNSITLNHLLLLSRADGRGIKVMSDSAWVMVKGSYSLQ